MTNRLSKTDWVEFGLKTLAEEGPFSLKADVLARRLNVSRGSFYWHFKKLDDFHTEVLAAWASVSVNIAQGLGTVTDPKQRLSLLMAAADASTVSLEAAIRSWAKNNSKIVPKVKEVDEFRIQFIIQIFREMGFDGERATARARFLYAASLGRTVSFLPDPDINQTMVDEIAELLATNIDKGNKSNPSAT